MRQRNQQASGNRAHAVVALPEKHHPCACIGTEQGGIAGCFVLVAGFDGEEIRKRVTPLIAGQLAEQWM